MATAGTMAEATAGIMAVETAGTMVVATAGIMAVATVGTMAVATAGTMVEESPAHTAAGTAGPLPRAVALNLHVPSQSHTANSIFGSPG